VPPPEVATFATHEVGVAPTTVTQEIRILKPKQSGRTLILAPANGKYAFVTAVVQVAQTAVVGVSGEKQ
jgi:hypothetical protein